MNGYQKTDGRYDTLKEIVDQARSGEVELVASALVLVLAEVYKSITTGRAGSMTELSQISPWLIGEP